LILLAADARIEQVNMVFVSFTTSKVLAIKYFIDFTYFISFMETGNWEYKRHGKFPLEISQLNKVRR